jgi:hypothetical protein
MSRALDTLWDDTVATALLGVERRALAAHDHEAGSDDRLGRLLAGIRRAEPARALLDAAAAIALYRRVGRLPAMASEPLPPACAADDVPACSPRAAWHLKRILGGEHRQVLEEWLTVLARSGRRVAEECLVDLLEYGRGSRGLQPLIARVLGNRGHWLAATNREWILVGEETADESVWETGTHAERLALLRRLRADSPERARALIESTWSQSPPEQRQSFLSALVDGLSMADEPLLEAALDDRRAEVRRAAAEVLVKLPESRLVARMKARLFALLKLTGGRQPAFEAVLPDRCDKAMVRDGLESKASPSAQGMGQKGWWLCQMVAAVPPATWCETFAADPAALIAAADRSEWKQALWLGWARAVMHGRDAAWAEAILAGPRPREDVAQAAALLPLLASERREAIVLSYLQADTERLNENHPAARLIAHCQHAWSVDFARVVIDRVRKCVPTDDFATAVYLSRLLPDLARWIPPALADEVHERWSGVQTHPAGSINPDDFLALLRFRHEMLTELAR